MAVVCINHHSHVALELGRTKKKVMAILAHDGLFRRVRRFSIESFDREWKPTTKSAAETAQRWLESHNKKHRLLSEGAKKEIDMLLVIQNNKVVAKFRDEDQSKFQSFVDKIDGPCEAICSAAELANYTGKDIAELHNSLVADSSAHIDRARDKNKIAERIMTMAEELKYTEAEEEQKKRSILYLAVQNNRHCKTSLRSQVYVELEKYPNGATEVDIANALNADLTKVRACLAILYKDKKVTRV